MSAPLLSAAVQSPTDLVAQAPPTQGKDPREAAKQFEGFLLANLFQQLRKTVHSSGFLGGGMAQSSYEFLLDQAVVSHAMDAGKTWGLTDKLEADFRSAQKK